MRRRQLIFLDTEKFTQKRSFLICLIAIFSAISFIQIINILTPPAKDYIPDLYDYYPFVYWGVILVLTFFCGFLLIYFTRSKIYNAKIILVIFALFVISVTLFLQFSFIFYFLGRGDPLTHLGYVKDILLSSHIADADIYPATHLFISSSSDILGVTPISVMRFVPVIFFSVYFISMCAIGRHIFKNNSFFYFFIGLAILPIFGQIQSQFNPNTLMILLAPLVIYNILKSDSKYFKEFFVFLLIVSIFIIFGHPLVSILLIITLLIGMALIFLLRSYNMQFSNKISLFITSTILLSILYYYVNLKENSPQEYFLIYVSKILFYSQEVDAELLRQTSLIQPTTSIFTLVRCAFFLYGPYLILATISGLIFLYILVSYLIYKKRFDFFLIFISVCSFFFFFLAMISFIISPYGMTRIYNMGVVFSLILIPLFLSNLITEKPDLKRRIIYFMQILFSILVVISIFSVYPSEHFTGYGNEQVTESEFFSMTTFLKYRENLPFMDYDSRTARFYHAIYGMEAAAKNNMLSYSERKPEKHFGYDTFSTFSESYGSNIYFIDSKLEYFSNNYPERLPPLIDKITYLVRFNNDPTVNRVYSNSRTSVYLIG